jgi:hypothetical protein
MRVGIVAVVALAVGLAVGYLLGAARETAAPARSETAARATGDLRRELPPRADTPVPPGPRETPIGNVERGNGTISGRVLRPDGVAVAGVVIRATPVAEPGHPDGGIEDEARRFARDLERRRAGIAEATTDGEGTYSIHGLGGGAYDVTGKLAGLRVAPVRKAAAVRAGATVDFTAEPVGKVSFDVRMPDGTEAPDATIRITAPRPAALSWTRDDPDLLLPTGALRCVAEHGDGDYVSEEASLEVREGAPDSPPVRLQLREVTGIRGTLLFGRDFPFSWAAVGAVAFTADEPPDASSLADRDWDEKHRAWTGASDGFRYRLLDLPQGRYMVVVFVDQAVVASRVVDVGPGVLACDFRIDAIDPSLYVVVRVLDPAGKPLPDVTFGTGYRTERQSSSSSGETFPVRPDGSYLIFHHAHSGAEGGTYSVRATSERYGTKKVEYKRDDTKEIVIRFDDPATVDLTIRGFTPGPQGDALRAALEAEGSTEAPSGSPDALGRVTLGPVPPGDYRLVLRTRTGDWRSFHVASQDVTLVAGKNTFVMPMPRLFTLVVTDPERKPGTLVLGPGGGAEYSPDVDDAGRAVYPALPEGTYGIRRTGDQSGEMRVTLPGPFEVTFRPQPYSALRVVLIGADNAWTKAGFLDGDLIVAIDGKELKDRDDLDPAEATFRASEVTTLTILRAGERLELRAHGKELGHAPFGRLVWSSR